jgi:hypothetical protein
MAVPPKPLLTNRTAIAFGGFFLFAVVFVMARFTVAHFERAFFDESASDAQLLKRTCESFELRARWDPSPLERDGYRVHAAVSREP